MKNLLLILTICFLSVLSAEAQCVSDANEQCVPNATMDRISRDLAELKESRVLIATLQSKDAARALASADKDALISKLREVISIDDMTSAAKDKYIAMLASIDKLKDDLIVQLEKKANHNKSFLQRLLVKLQILYYIVAGVAIVAK